MRNPDKPVVFLLHGLGCSARTWDPVVELLTDEFRCVALDLPGHGDRAGSSELTVEQMADWFVGTLLDHRPSRWALVAHSMSGKVATVVASRTERGMPGLTRPFALVLVAASPLSPEPMDEGVRGDMIGWAADGAVSAEHAREYVDANTAASLPADRLEPAVADVQRVSRTAWLAWLERGSREDWSAAIDAVRTPTLVVAGAEDGPLGVDTQRQSVVPHVAAEDVVEIPGAAHLIMLEQPQRLAALVAEHLASAQRSLSGPLDELLESDRVSARTRRALRDRIPEPTDGPRVLDDAQRSLLAALLARVVPQRGARIDLAGRIDAALGAGASDGWRFAALPPDPDAWRRGLDTLAGLADDFADLGPAEQDRWIQRMIDGRAGSDDPGHLTSEQMTLWFEDVRAEAVRTWLSHPAALARIGYDGFANGGDGIRKQGYLLVGAGEREPWQLDLPLTSDSASSA